jgi:hypothetical protein
MKTGLFLFAVLLALDSSCKKKMKGKVVDAEQVQAEKASECSLL